MTRRSSPSWWPRGARPSTTYSPTTEPFPISTFGATTAVGCTATPSDVMRGPGSYPRGLAVRDARTVLSEAAHPRLEHAHDAEPGLAVAARARAVAHALDEVPDLELEGLSDRHARAVDVAGPVRAAELLARQRLDAVVVNLHTLR